MARTLILCLLCVGSVLGDGVAAQQGGRRLDMKAQVLNALFPLEVGQKAHFIKMVLRFGDLPTQLMIVVYPGGKSEIVRFRLRDLNGDQLEQLISKAIADKPQVKPEEIAATVKVDVVRSPIDYDTAIAPAIEELKSIRISPVLASRVAVDEFSEFGFWYDTWQESVHYTIVSPFQNEPQDELGKWMLRFRAKAEEWLKGKSGVL